MMDETYLEALYCLKTVLADLPGGLMDLRMVDALAMVLDAKGKGR